MAEFGPAFDARLFNQRAYNRLITVQDNVGQPFIQSHARGFHGFTVRVRHAHHCPGHGLHLVDQFRKMLQHEKAPVEESGNTGKECSLRTGLRPPPCVPSPTVQNDSGDGAWTKTFFVIYCFY